MSFDKCIGPCNHCCNFIEHFYHSKKFSGIYLQSVFSSPSVIPREQLICFLLQQISFLFQKQIICCMASFADHVREISSLQYAVVAQSLSHIQLFVTPWIVALQASLFFTIMSNELVMPSNNLIPCCPLLLLSSFFPTVRVFSNELAFPMWPKFWSFSINPSNEYSGLISFSIGWFDLLAVQGTLRSSLAPQCKSISSSALAFFMVQLSHLYMTTGKTIAFTVQTFVGKVLSQQFISFNC